MSEILIRPYQQSDLEQCRALWTELTEHHRELYNDPTIGGLDPSLHFDRHLARVGSDHLWVAVGDEVLGLVGLVVGQQEAEVEPIVVARCWRGRGIGQLLLERAIAEARRLGVRFLNVRPVARNTEAISWFHRAGFRVLGHVELFVDLQPRPGSWQPGPTLFGCRFEC